MVGSRSVMLWMGVILFLVLGVSIGLSVASAMVADGSSALIAVAMGACAGGYGAYFVFFIVLNIAERLRMWMTGKQQARDS